MQGPWWRYNKTGILVEMGKRFLHYTLLLLLCQGFEGVAGGQSAFNPSYSEWAAAIKERLTIFTDRSLYLVNESIHFRAEIKNDVLKDESWSTVLYAELITSTGRSIAQAKYPINNGVSTGDLPIPASTLTGNYFLKCYTRWMRNFNPEEFSFVPLRIINPYRIEVEESSIQNRFTSNLFRQAYRRGVVTCKTDSRIYEKGREVSLGITVPPKIVSGHLDGCITVVPSGTIDTVSGQLILANDQQEPDDFEVVYLPDLGRGPSISGVVVNTFNKPVELAQVFFSILGREPDLISAITDNNGRYALAMPHRIGPQEIYVVARSNEVVTPLVKVDPEFDVSPLSIPAGRFWLTEKEKETCTRMFLNTQFGQTYGYFTGQTSGGTKNYPFPFYGLNAFRINLDEYITLPNLEEVFLNLASRVQVVKERGSTYLKIDSELIKDQEAFTSTLLLIDNVAIFDHEAILVLPAERISHIDIIDKIYIKGEVIFGGIVSIFSKKGDLAGIELPASSFFFDFLSFQAEESIQDISGDQPAHIPDCNNTVFWLNHVELDSAKPTEISFTAPLLKGDYVVLVRSLSDSGEVLSASAGFRVH